MAGRKYNSQQIQRQLANSIRNQESSPTINHSQKENIEYNESVVSAVPSEARGLDKLIDLF